MSEDSLNQIVEVLSELKEDQGVPRNVKTKIENTIKILEESAELSIKVNKALHELDDVVDDTNIQAYTRTQMLNIVSMLEQL